MGIEVVLSDASIEASGTDEVYFDSGHQVAEVSIDVDHAIIKHFSDHLYSSPNKAIEELVSNAFDALATTCHVYLPGEHATGKVVVWDNGVSMDMEAIEAMWKIARSPKDGLGPGRIFEAEGSRRAVIGKFGIGKLASYAVGNRITHICRSASDMYLSVSVDYQRFAPDQPGGLDATDGGDGPPEPVSSTAVRQLTQGEAEAAVRQVLTSGAALDAMFQEDHWTCAVIDELREDKVLYPGRLKWILGNGMPLRPDFRVWVDDDEVHPRLASNASTTWSLTNIEVASAITSAWKDAVSKGTVEGEIDFGPPPLANGIVDANHPEADVPAIKFPVLGRVTARIRLFEDSLSSQSTEGRSYGYFLMVRGRLVNADDDKLLLNDPSFGTFYRSQFVIGADAVDAELLADRESLRRDTPMTAELRVLQSALYRAARSEIERTDTEQSLSQRSESRLPNRSREFFRDPIAAISARTEPRGTSVNLDEPRVTRRTLGEREGVASIDPANGDLLVNSSHPFYRIIEQQAGGGKKGAAVMRAFDLVAIAERLTEGFLYGMGLQDSQVLAIVEWRERLLRVLAEGYERNPDDAISELRNASYDGDKRFEIAVATILRMMGFSAVRDGAPGEKDVVLVAPVGPEHSVFIAEAKGSKSAVVNVTAAIASAASHRDKVEGATHAIVVAREFSGFARKDAPAILEECRAVGGVSLVTVEVLVSLFNAVNAYAYPLRTVIDILFKLEAPASKLRRVAALEAPMDKFDFVGVLEEIWSRQEGSASGDVVSTREVYQSRAHWKATMGHDDFLAKLAALQHFTGELMVLDTAQQTVHIAQNPEYVSEQASRVMAPTNQSAPSFEPPQKSGG